MSGGSKAWFRNGSWVGLGLLLVAGVGWGDPTPVVHYQGGNVVPLGDHPTIALTEEVLTFSLRGSAVTATVDLRFANQGPACEVKVGFPVLCEYPESEPYGSEEISVAVDGAALTKTSQVGEVEIAGKQQKCRWWVYAVAFAENQARRMVVEYPAGPVHADRMSYVLATGANWRGNIGKLRVEVDPDDRRNFEKIALWGDGQPLPVREQEGRLVWETTEYQGTPALLQPKAKGALGIHYPLSGGGFWWYWADPIRRYRGRVLMTPRELERTTLAKCTGREGELFDFEKEGRKAKVEGFEQPLPATTRMDWYLDAKPVLEAFGAGVSVTTVDGYDRVEIVLAPRDAAHATALSTRQAEIDRLQCLECLADEAPESAVAACKVLAARKDEVGAPWYWAWCYLVGRDAAGSVDAAAAPAGPARVDGAKCLARTIIGSSYGGVGRGGGWVLAKMDPTAQGALLAVLAEDPDTWDGRRRGATVKRAYVDMGRGDWVKRECQRLLDLHRGDPHWNVVGLEAALATVLY